MRGRTYLGRAAALAISVSLLAAACGDDSGSKQSSSGGSGSSSLATPGDGKVKCSGLAIGFFGALTGDNANLGINIKKGAQLAIDSFNAKNKDCQVSLKDFDSQGSADKAPALADQAISDKAVVGIVGPAFSGESRAANPKFDQAGLPIITPSATNPALSTNGWKIFHRALAGDDKQGPAIATYIKNTLKPKAVGVIDDNSEYGKGLADIVRKELGDSVKASDTIDPKATSFSAAVTKMKSANVDVIFYGGYYAEAGKLAKQLKDEGIKATLVGGDGVLDKGFVDGGGPAAEGTVITCTCAPGDSNKAFFDAYKAKFNSDPATYGAEAYDSANAFLEAIAAGKTDRASINTFLSTYNKAGVTKTLKWDAKGEIEGNAVYAYQVKSGKITSLGLIK